LNVRFLDSGAFGQGEGDDGDDDSVDEDVGEDCEGDGRGYEGCGGAGGEERGWAVCGAGVPGEHSFVWMERWRFGVGSMMVAVDLDVGSVSSQMISDSFHCRHSNC